MLRVDIQKEFFLGRVLPKVVKRDGAFVDFDRGRIERAISKAFKAVGEPLDGQVLEELVLEVVKRVLRSDRPAVHVEEIQDIVEETLIVPHPIEKYSTG